MMRILALTNLYPTPYQPNRATFNRQQFRALAAEHEMQVIAPIAWTGEWAARRRNRGAIEALPADRRRVFDGMLIHHPRYAFTPKVLRGLYGHFMASSVRRCFHEAAADFRPDVVLGCWAYPDGWAAARLAREAGLPVAVKAHGSDLLTIDDQPVRRRRTVEALRAADAVIAVSSHLAARAVSMGADQNRVHVVRNGIDAETFRPGSPGEARRQLEIDRIGPLILFVGNLVPVKALNVLIDALASLARTGRRFQCAMIGDGPLRAPLQTQIDSLGLEGKVRLLGPRPQHELPSWYRAADLVVLPSLSEGIPNVLLEAAACGTPFVASNVGGIPEIAPDEALVPAGNSEALAERINIFLDPATRPAASMKHAPSSWQASAKTLAAVLRTIAIPLASPLARAG